jgi:hypothetical protein
MEPELGEVRHLRIKRRDVAGFQSDLTAVLFQCQHPGELPADEELFDAAQRLVRAWILRWHAQFAKCEG